MTTPVCAHDRIRQTATLRCLPGEATSESVGAGIDSGESHLPGLRRPEHEQMAAPISRTAHKRQLPRAVPKSATTTGRRKRADGGTDSAPGDAPARSRSL